MADTRSEVPSDARSEVALLYRRAGFGARADELDAAERAGYEATVGALVAARTRLAEAAAGAAAETDPPPPALDVAATARPGEAGTAAKAAYVKALREQNEAAVGWWLGRMVTTADPLTEKLTLFWHGHFATSVVKVRSPALMLAQNQILRTGGVGAFPALTLAVAHDPAMLVWLDAGKNSKGRPNENFARELMELFTLGIGNYSESDVREAARCFTGWRAGRGTGGFRVVAAAHDDGTKTVLGHTGNLSGDDVIAILTHQPASARWVCSRLLSAFASPAAPGDAATATLLPAYSAGLEVGAAVRAMLLAPAFRRSAGQIVTAPIAYVVGVLRVLGPRVGAAGANGPTAPSRLLGVLSGLGQVPFAPPSVGGWPAGAAWLTTASSLVRARFARAVAAAADVSAIADEPRAGRVDALARMLAVSRWTERTRSALTAAADDPHRLVALGLVSPEYVVT